jgi:2-polyprenyl-6-hydroxyphenyl methylase/3-demethylubiquinone-9 3-methyltransferase
MNNDRVLELYQRMIFSPHDQDACRERIHWLCSHVRGNRVLDVGCSQGIVPIILAREGINVVGLDIEPNAIEVAQKAVSEEGVDVQDRITLQVGDAFTTDFELQSFDTVIAGEVLEHLSQPARLLKKISDWLRPKGCLVLSVPHGYHPFLDHKQSFYLNRLIDLLSPRFHIKTVETVFAQFLCAVAARPPEGQLPQMPAFQVLRQWQSLCDESIEELQRRAHRELLAR